MPVLSLGAIVHVGYHKTATTWFQNQVFPRASSHAFVPRKITQEALLVPPGLYFDPQEARRVLAAEGRNRPLLLSEENLTGYLHNGGLHGLVGPEMARRIKATLPQARIVMFVRNQFDILRASYAQYVAGGGTWGQKRYFDTAAHVRGALTRPWKAPVFEFEHFAFDRLVAHYDALFGRDRVHVYPYEWLREPEAMLARMQDDLGLELESAPPSNQRANPSLGGVAMTLLRAANLFTRQSVVNKDRIVDLPGGQVLRHAAKAVIRRVPCLNRHAAALPEVAWRQAEAFYPASNRRLLAIRPELRLAELGYPV
jgi:hypothetical protein